jgi:hypothetical protein
MLLRMPYKCDSDNNGFLRKSLCPMAWHVASPSIAKDHTGPTYAAAPVATQHSIAQTSTPSISAASSVLQVGAAKIG